MKMKLRLTTLEQRENPSASPTADPVAPLAPPAVPTDIALQAQDNIAAGESLYVGTSWAGVPLAPPAGPTDMTMEARDGISLGETLYASGPGPIVYVPDTFVGPPENPSRRRIALPMLLPGGDYGVEFLPWDRNHPLWPRDAQDRPVPSDWRGYPIVIVTTPPSGTGLGAAAGGALGAIPGTATAPGAAPATVPTPGSSTLPLTPPSPAPTGPN